MAVSRRVDSTHESADTDFLLTADMVPLTADAGTGIANWPPIPKREWRKGRENDESILIHLLH